MGVSESSTQAMIAMQILVFELRLWRHRLKVARRCHNPTARAINADKIKMTKLGHAKLHLMFTKNLCNQG